MTASNNGVSVPLTVLTSTYDTLGNRETLSANAGGSLDFLNTYVYDVLNRMTSVTQQGQTGGRTVANKRVDLTYDALGRFDTITRRAGLLTSSAVVAATDYAYDLQGRLTGISHAKGTNVLADYLYGYDFADRLTSFESDTDSVSYFYDPFGQLRYEDHSSQPDKTYPYDATGNRVAADFEAETGNRVVEDATHEYQYDAEGNLTRETEKATGSYQTYEWDHRNQLVRVELRNSVGLLTAAVEYDYDVLHRLIRRQADTNGNGSFDEAQKFVYDGTQIVLVFDDSGTVTNRMLWGPAVDQLFSDENAVNDVLWALTDNLGSVREVIEYDDTTDTTTIVNEIVYDAYGNVVSESNPNKSPLFKYTARYFDPITGKQNNLNRWYTPRTGTWMRPDPGGFPMGDMNLYRYVGNGPTNGTDPYGLQGRALVRPSGPPVTVVPGGFGNPSLHLNDAYFEGKRYIPTVVCHGRSAGPERWGPPNSFRFPGGPGQLEYYKGLGDTSLGAGAGFSLATAGATLAAALGPEELALEALDITVEAGTGLPVILSPSDIIETAGRNGLRRVVAGGGASLTNLPPTAVYELSDGYA